MVIEVQGEGKKIKKGILWLMVCGVLFVAIPAQAATTNVTIIKLANNGVTILNQTTVDYTWMKLNLPVLGDGVTHYYAQGPTFNDSDHWDSAEYQNVLSRDWGALKGTDAKLLCDLVGGMNLGEMVKFKANDGFYKTFPYEYVYTPDPRQGPMTICWYNADQGGYVPAYTDGMRLIMFADTSTNPWGYHVFGNWDMHECWNSKYWYNYSGIWPSSGGTSVKYISDIVIYSNMEPPEVHSIEVIPAEVTIETNDTQQFSAIARDQYGKEMSNITFAWTSSNESVGTINTTGFFTALAKGETIVAAGNGTVNGTTTVTVTHGGGGGGGDGGGAGSDDSPSGPTAGTTEVHIVKYANDGATVLKETTVDYKWMMNNLEIYGDGVTHYYHQGPIFQDEWEKEHPQETWNLEEDKWNPEEDVNVPAKDMGAVKGTNVKDLCDLVGGMSEGDTVEIKAIDGFYKKFLHPNVYRPQPRQGPIVVTWYKDGQYPDTGFSDGMRLTFFADTSINPWGKHVFGISDMKACLPEGYWHYYQFPDYPTTTGYTVKNINRIFIHSSTILSEVQGGGQDATIPILTTVKITPSFVTLNVSETQQFNATAYDHNNQKMVCVLFNWTSSNTSVGTINETGFFIPCASGVTTIQAINGSVNGTATVVVSPPILTLSGTPRINVTPSPSLLPSPFTTPSTSSSPSPLPTYITPPPATKTPLAPAFESVFTLIGVLTVVYLIKREKIK